MHKLVCDCATLCDAICDAVCDAISDVSRLGNPRRAVMRRGVFPRLRLLLWDNVHQRLSCEVHRHSNQTCLPHTHHIYMKSEGTQDQFPIPELPYAPVKVPPLAPLHNRTTAVDTPRVIRTLSFVIADTDNFKNHGKPSTHNFMAHSIYTLAYTALYPCQV